MAFIGHLRKSWGRSQSEEAELHGDQILSAIVQERAKHSPVDPKHEERACRSLDSIYAPETIDLKTVKPLAAAQKKEDFGFIPAPLAVSESTQLPLPIAPCTPYPSDQVLIPWIERRGGLATKDEIDERLERTTKTPFIQDDSSLIMVEEALFAARADCAQEFAKIKQLAMTYFYRRDLSYPLTTLVSLMEKELAKEWMGMPRQLMMKWLTDSRTFCLYKDSDHRLSLRLR